LADTQLAPPVVLRRRPPHGETWLRRFRHEMADGADPRWVRRRAELAEGLQRPVTTGRGIAVASVRGGAGKSSVTALVGTALATHRGDRVATVDADPELGSLAARLDVGPGPSMRALFGAGAQPDTFEQLGRYLHQTPHGLWVLAGRGAPGAPPVDVTSFAHAQHAFSRYFAVSLVDCGAGLYDELTAAVLSRAHALLLTAPATADGVGTTREALDLVAATPLRPLLERCVLTLVSCTADTSVDTAAAVRHLSVHGVHVVPLPHDRHLAAGAAIEFGRLSQGVRDGVLEAGAEALRRATRPQL